MTSIIRASALALLTAALIGCGVPEPETTRVTNTLPATTRAQAPAATTAPPPPAYGAVGTTLDAYWSDDGDSYYIVQTGLSDYDFCEAYLTNNGRRVGVDGYTIEETAGRERVTFEFYLPAIFDPPDFDGYEFECVDYGF
ncbi:MAG: hypothetical protein F4Y75_06335 [Acidimicrobiia bacterium]|nr:hypothetical protein [bacterium]MDE0644308.1 hypothetical protein [bacterium]MXZ07109.1 hypothetical protein [Acidimicrobiia bacterium]MYH56225.1 hypothetical protein [Acidimicrobiia bacterium]